MLIYDIINHSNCYTEQNYCFLFNIATFINNLLEGTTVRQAEGGGRKAEGGDLRCEHRAESGERKEIER